jgi:hypothetical protein
MTARDSSLKLTLFWGFFKLSSSNTSSQLSCANAYPSTLIGRLHVRPTDRSGKRNRIGDFSLVSEAGQRKEKVADITALGGKSASKSGEETRQGLEKKREKRK